MSAPLISVVLPTHNRAPTLRRALRSVLAQSHQALELIVVDDASTDDTEQIVAGCGDSRVRYVQLAQRAGPAAARNEGLRLARGELAAFQDSDDEWLTFKLARQLELMAACPDVRFVVGSYIIVEPGATRLVSSPALAAGRGYESELLTGYPLATPTWLVRTALLRDAGLFDTSLPCLEDWDLGLRISDRCRMQAVLDPVLIKHGARDTMSADSRRHLAGLCAIYERHARRWQGHARGEARLLTEIGRLQCRFGYRRHGLGMLQRAVRRDPSFAFAWWSLAAGVAGRAALREGIGIKGRRATPTVAEGDV